VCFDDIISEMNSTSIALTLQHDTGIYFAQVYGSGSYSTCTYGTIGNQTTNCSSSSSSSNSGVLTNTGFDILLGATIACAIIFVALMVRFWKRPKKPNGQPPATN